MHMTFSPERMTGRPRSKWENNINVVLKEMGKTFVNTVTDIRVL
jgi:hypothetical protein